MHSMPAEEQAEASKEAVQEDGKRPLAPQAAPTAPPAAPPNTHAAGTQAESVPCRSLFDIDFRFF